MVSNFLIYGVVLLVFAIIATVYISTRPTHLRLPFSILAIDLIFGFVLLTFLETIPIAALYVIILASTPFIAAGILALTRMGRRIRATMQAGDVQQENALITPFFLVMQLVVLPTCPIYEFIRRSPTIQLSLNFGFSCFFTIVLCAGGFRLAIDSLKESSRWRYLRFGGSLALIAGAMLFEYEIVRIVFHLF